jgi:hypothetical protein
MGASGWGYFVPYQPNIDQALQKLREEVFRRGEYFLRPPMDINPDDYADMPEEIREQVPNWIEREKSFQQPTTIADLMKWNAEEGTHSILDIKRISSVPDFGAAAPFSTEELTELFGTEQPSQSMVIEKAETIRSLRERYQATYIIVFKNNIPDEIYFTGYSGD